MTPWQDRRCCRCTVETVITVDEAAELAGKMLAENFGDSAAEPPIPPHVAVWRSVRVHGETKTERSRRTLGLPARITPVVPGAVQVTLSSDLQFGLRGAFGRTRPETAARGGCPIAAGSGN